MSSRQLTLRLDLDSGAFTAGIRQADGTLRRFGGASEQTNRSIQRMERRMRGALSTARDLTVVLGQARAALLSIRDVTVGWAGAIVRSNMEMERMTFLLRGLSDATTEAGQAAESMESFEYLINLAKEAPFSINGLSDSFVKLRSVGIDPTNGSMESLVDAVAAFGGNDHILHRASIAIQQMGGKGVISMEELRQQLGEAVPSAMMLMARSMDMSVRDLVDRISRGQVEASSALDKLFGEFERTFGGSAQNMMETFSGELARVRTAVAEFFMDIGGRADAASGSLFTDSGFMGQMKQTLSEIYFFLQSPEAANFARQVGDGLAQALISMRQFVATIFQMKDVLVTAGKAALILMGALATRAVITSAIAGFASLTAGLKALSAILPALNLAMSNTYNSLAVMGARGATVGVTVRNLVPTFRALGTAIAGALGPISLIATGLFFAADAFGLFRNRTNEAEEAWRQFEQGIDDPENIRALEAELERLENRQRALTRAVEEGSVAFFNPGDPTSRMQLSDEQVADYRKELEETGVSAEQVEERIARMQERIADSRATSAARTQFREIQEGLDTVRTSYRVTATAIQEELNALAQAEGLTAEDRNRQEEELNSRRLANVRKYYDDRIALLREEEAALGGEEGVLRAFMFGNTTEAEMNADLALLGMIEQKIVDIAEARAQAMAVAERDNNFLIGGDDFAEEMDRLRDRYIEVSAEASNFGDEVAAYRAQLEGAVDENENRVWSDEQVAALVERFEELQEATRELEQARTAERSFDRIAAEANKAQQEVDLLREAMSDGNLSESEQGLARFEARLRAIADEGGEASAELHSMVDGIVENRRASQALRWFGDLEDQLEELNADLADNPAAARAQLEYDRAIEELEEYVEAYREQYGNIDDIAEASSRYRQQLEERLAVESETPMQEMLRKWRNTTEAMQEAQADWFQDFTDGLVEGDLNMGEFVQEMLKDILRIYLRASMAAAFAPIITGTQGLIQTGVGSILGGLPGFDGAMPGAKSKPVGFNGLHSGGVAGSDASFHKRLKLPQFHTGGIVGGLENNEVMAVLQKGEGVFTREQMRALGGEISKPVAPPAIDFNLVNQSGQPMSAEQSGQRFDGEKYIVDVVLKNLSRPGPLRDTVKASR